MSEQLVKMADLNASLMANHLNSSSILINNSSKSEKKVYVPKPKTPEQQLAWETYKQSINNATSGGDVLKATLVYEISDKAQAAFAFNRAKKFLENIGRFTEEKWRGKGYGNMGKMRQEFYAEFYRLESIYLSILKEQVITPTASGEKKKKLAPNFNFKVQHSLIPTSNSIAENASVPVPNDDINKNRNQLKAKKRLHSELDSFETVATSNSTSSGHNIGSSANELDITETEKIRSIKAARLADAMQHPAFQLLTKSQQQALRQEWMAVLLNKNVEV